MSVLRTCLCNTFTEKSLDRLVLLFFLVSAELMNTFGPKDDECTPGQKSYL